MEKITNLGKLLINRQLPFSCTEFNELSLFHTQFIIDLFFFTQFQSHCVYKLFLIQKSKYGTNLTHKEGKQEETTID